MRNRALQKAIDASADPTRVRQGFDQLQSSPAAAALKDPQQIRILAALFAGSQAMGECLLKHPEWLAQSLDPELLRHPRQEQGLRREVQS